MPLPAQEPAAGPPADLPPPVEAPAEPVPPAAAPSGSPPLLRTVLILACLVCALIGLMAGYLIGFNQNPVVPATSTKNIPAPAADPTPPAGDPTPEVETTPAPVPPAEEKPPAEKNPQSETPSTPPVEPTPPAPEPIKEEPPAPVPAEPAPPTPEESAEAALRSFLAAPDWRARSAYVLDPERVRPKMEALAADGNDGPTADANLKVAASPPAEPGAPRLFSFILARAGSADGFPVAVAETADGWKVDWETFVEFRDDHFQRFAAGEGSEIGAFHLLVRNTHYFGPNFPGIDKLTAFRVDPPMPDRTRYAFVATGSDLHKQLADATEWGAPCSPVLELFRKIREDGNSHLEITGIVAPNWRPAVH